jgi:signal transduction histidine kinase
VLKMLFHSLDLKFGGDDPRAKDAAIIEQKMEHMNRILDSILTFARRSEPDLRPTDLNALLDDVLLLVRHKLAQQNIALHQELSPGLPQIALDRTQIEQVILNLILNAAQAMASGGKLTLTTRGDASGVWLSVTDTGVGITPEARQRLFDPFLTTKPAGTGLGLALAHKIIEAHKGRIEVESEPGKGTTFRILLPA